MADLGRAMGFAQNHTPHGDAADAFVHGVIELSERVGIPQRLSEVGVADEFVPQMAVDAAESGNVKSSPRLEAPLTGTLRMIGKKSQEETRWSFCPEFIV